MSIHLGDRWLVGGPLNERTFVYKERTPLLFSRKLDASSFVTLQLSFNFVFFHYSSPSARHPFIMAATGNRFSSPRNSFTKFVFGAVALLVVFGLITIRPSPKIQRFTEQIGLQKPKAPPQKEEPKFTTDCSINSTRLYDLKEKFNLTDHIEYGRRYIHFTREDVERKSLTRINEDLFPEDFDEIDIQSPPDDTKCMKPLEVPVPNSPFPNTVNAADLLFGVSTTYGRLTDKKTSPLAEWSHWLTDGRGNSNGGGLVLRLVDATEEQLDESRRRLTALGINVKVYPSNSSEEMAQRYLSLLPTLYNDVSRKNRKWLVMCDDDTFFPSMHALLHRLSQYNHKSDMYIGTFSEDVNNIQRHGSQAFGGAGVFFSLHMASIVTKLYDQCSTPEKVAEANTGWGPQGDVLLRKCIYENTEIRLTLLKDLHQLDIMGDPSGFYESGIAPLSLHHFKGGIWTKANVNDGALVQYACGEDCFLQRFLTNDDFIISNGYSIAYYPKGIQFDVNQMERTFSAAPDDYGWNLDFMLGPQRRDLSQTGRKVAWELQQAEIQNNGTVLQTYVRKASDKRWTENGKAMFELDGVLELIWVP